MFRVYLSTAEKTSAIDKYTRWIKTNEARCFASALFPVFSHDCRKITGNHANARDRIKPIES